MRIAKYIANAGFCSRREAEKLIEKKIVKINNELLCIIQAILLMKMTRLQLVNK